MMKTKKLLSPAGRNLTCKLQDIVSQYEGRCGQVPGWMMSEIPPLHAAALLESAIRIGIPYCVQDLDLIAPPQGG